MRHIDRIMLVTSLLLAVGCGLKPSGEGSGSSDIKRHGQDDNKPQPDDRGGGQDDQLPDHHGGGNDDDCREDGDDHHLMGEADLLSHGRGRGRGRGRGGHSGGNGSDDNCSQNPTPPGNGGQGGGGNNGGGGGGNSGGGGGDNSGPPLSYQDVAPIIQTACVKCHNPNGAADFLPLQTFAQVQAARTAMISAISSGFMPMGNAAFKNSPEAATLLKWLRSGQN